MVSMLCKSCGKKLAEVSLKNGIVSVKCNKCGTITKVEADSVDIKALSTKSTVSK